MEAIQEQAAAPAVEVTASAPVTLQPDTTAIQEAANALIERAAPILEIRTTESYEAAGALVIALRDKRRDIKKDIEAFFDPHVRAAKAVHTGLCDARTAHVTKHDTPLAQAETKLLLLMNGYSAWVKSEQVRIAKENEEARMKAEKEEADRKAEAERKAEADRLATLKANETERVEKAAELEADGDHEAAQLVLMAAPPEPEPPPPPTPSAPAPMPTFASLAVPMVPKVAGIATRKNWKWRPIGGEEQRRAAVRAILTQAIKGDMERMLGFLDLHDKSLDGTAKALEADARVPGIEFYNDPISQVGGKRKG